MGRTSALGLLRALRHRLTAAPLSIRRQTSSCSWMRDTVVVGSLNDLVRQAANADAVLAWPAWQPPPDLDWAEVFQRLGLVFPAATMAYSGYGVAFMSPKDAPPYFNYGFVAIPRSLALVVGPMLHGDIGHVWSTYQNWFTSQIALCTTIVRARCSYPRLGSPLQLQQWRLRRSRNPQS